MENRKNRGFGGFLREAGGFGDCGGGGKVGFWMILGDKREVF